MKVELDTFHEQQSNYGSSVANLVFHGGNPTFSEFCDFIAENSKDKWGEICVVKNGRLILQDNPDQVEYSYGKLKNKPKEEYADRRIKKGTCWYSWNNYSYYVELESEKQRPKQTNADRIQGMLNEELATFLTNNQVEVFRKVVKEMCNQLDISFPNEEITKEVTAKYEEMKKEQLEWLIQEAVND